MKHDMTIQTWRITECGWSTYFAEVAALSKGRTDVQIECRRPGVISLAFVRLTGEMQ